MIYFVILILTLIEASGILQCKMFQSHILSLADTSSYQSLIHGQYINSDPRLQSD